MRCKLKDVIYVNPREKLPKGTIAKKVAMDKLLPFTRDIPSFEFECYSGGAKFRNGDTIMARITPCLENGKTAKVTILGENEIGFGSTEFIVFRAVPGITDPDYVYYLVCSPLVRDPAIKSMVGTSGRQRVQTDVVASIELDLPPIDEQQRIGKLMRLIDDKIEINRKINDNLQQQAMALFSKLFPLAGKADAANGILSDIAVITMGQSPSGESYNEIGNGVVFFQGRAEFGFRFPSVRLFTTEPKRMASYGDTLVSVRAPVGDLNIAHEDCCVGRGLAAVHSNNGHPSFILYTMLSLRNQLDVYNGQGTVFGSINRKAMNELSVFIPSNQEMDAFERLARPIDAMIRKNHDENVRLNKLRDTLLPRLMSGEIDVSSIPL